MEKAPKDSAERQAQLQLEDIVEMVERLHHAERGCGCDECGETDSRDEYHDEDKARQAITEDPLEISVRSGWTGVNEEMKPDSFMILLCTGGPAVRITGRLDEFGTPDRAQIEYQDWFTPWTRLKGLTKDDESALITYASQFYYAD